MTDLPPPANVPPDSPPPSGESPGDAPPPSRPESDSNKPPILPAPTALQAAQPEPPAAHAQPEPPVAQPVLEVEAVPLTRDDSFAPSIDTHATASNAPAIASAAAVENAPAIASAAPGASAPPILAAIVAASPSAAESMAAHEPAPASSSFAPPPIDPPASSSPAVAPAPPSNATTSESVPPSPPPRAAVPPPPSPPATAPSASDSRSARSSFWSVVGHLLYFLTIPFFFVGVIATFLVWQVFGKQDAHVEDQGREALNFQINVGILVFLLSVSCLGWPLVALTWVVAGFYGLIAASHAARGENYRYPWILRIVTH